MPVLCFPNLDTLRLALTSGIVPPEVALAPIRAAFDATNRPWIEVPTHVPREVVAALTRLGATVHGPATGPPTRSHSCWAELLPLKPDSAPQSGPVLIEMPDDRIAHVAAEVHRLRPQPVSIRLLPDTGRAWIVLRDPPLFTALSLASDDSCELFVQQAPRVWVQAGWHHPLDQLPVPPAATLLLRPNRDWQSVPDATPHTEAETYTVRSRSPGPSQTTTPTALTVRLSLRRTQRHGPESLWMLPGDAMLRLLNLIRETDERLLQQFEIAALGSGPDSRVVLRIVERTDQPIVLLPEVRGYVPHPPLPRLHLPLGFELAPAIRSTALARVFDLAPETVAWLELTTGPQFLVHQAPESTFHRLVDWITYTTPSAVPLAVVWRQSDLLATPRFVVEPERTAALPEPLPPKPEPEPTHVAPSQPEGWLGRLKERLFRGKPVTSKERRKSEPQPKVEKPTSTRRVGDKLESQHALLLGNEWSARRGALEQRVLTDSLCLPLRDRAQLWANLAEVYSAVGNSSDAAVCWLNAIWDAETVPPPWLANWLRAEAKAARIPYDGQNLTIVLRAGVARVAAAHLVWAASQASPPNEVVAALPQMLGLIEAHEPDVPVRMVWLARMAATQLTDGDPLGLARCRDRLFARLTGKGPGLDLDAPSFLRFRGITDGERYLTAREWLTRVRDPLHRWLAKFIGGRLQWAGLDAETNCTTAYADLMLAWAFSRLGDRTRAKEFQSHAETTLAQAHSAGVDPTVHRILRCAFAERIRAAQDGRPDRPGLPLDAAAQLPQLDDLGRYAVEKLRAYSGVLEPVDLVNAYRGRDLVEFLGPDRLGERLMRLLARADLAPETHEAAALLSLAHDDPTAATFPRVIFALLEVAPRLQPALVAELIPLATRAVELVPEWTRIAAPTGDPGAAVKRIGARLLTASCHTAALFHLPDSFRQVADAIRIAAESPDATAVHALELVAAPFFRTLRRLGLSREASELLTALGEPVAASARELGLAVGWFATGNEDAGNRVLNAARDRLFVEGISDERERTAVAIAYAAAVGHAPTRIALGRLEELFLRLDLISAHGATNRYYTLKPLVLIDTVVRSVVSDDFALGPGVRGWLDDDEYLMRRRITRDLEAALM